MAHSFEESSAMDSVAPSIASLGFWANKDVPLSTGVRKVTLPISKPTSAPQDVDPQLKSMCHVAQERAAVGGDIRWDVILEQAAQLPCGLRVCTADVPREPSKKTGSFDSDDSESTCGGSGSASEVTTEATEATNSSDTEYPALGRPVREKQKKHRPVSLASNKKADIARKEVEQLCVVAEAAEICYTLPFLLQVWAAMRSKECPENGSAAPSAEKQEIGHEKMTDVKPTPTFEPMPPPPGLEKSNIASSPREKSSKQATDGASTIKRGGVKGQTASPSSRDKSSKAEADVASTIELGIQVPPASCEVLQDTPLGQKVAVAKINAPWRRSKTAAAA